MTHTPAGKVALYLLDRVKYDFTNSDQKNNYQTFEGDG